MADRFEVSRTPVREVLKHLEIQGVVAHVPHRGAVVATLDYGQVVELYLMREVLEGTAARLAAQHATQVEIDVMHGMVARDRGLVGDTRELARMNRVFHQQVRDSARNRFLGQMLDNFRLSVALLAGTTLGLPGRGTSSVEEHGAIVERIASRDARGAEEAARLHIHNAFHARILVQQGGGRRPQ